MRFDSSFDTTVPQGQGEVSFQSGEAVIFLPRHVDLRGRTVTIRFMVRGPFEAEFTARILDRPGGPAHRQQLHAAPDHRQLVDDQRDLPRAAARASGRSSRRSTRPIAIILKVDATGDYRVWSGPFTSTTSAGGVLKSGPGAVGR